MKIENGIAQLCFTYDRAQKASRDPKRYDRRDHYTNILHDYRKAIRATVDKLMTETHKRMYVSDVSVQVAELTYFNTWFNRRGGWQGAEQA